MGVLMKKLITFIMSSAMLSFLFSMLYAESGVRDYLQVGLLKPELSNSTFLLNLQNEVDSKTLFNDEIISETDTDFALSSVSDLKTALKSFFVDDEREKSFLDYRVKGEHVQGSLKVSLIAGADYHTNTDLSYLNLYRGLQLRSNINNRFLMWGYWWACRFQGDLDFAEEHSPLIKGFYKPHGIDQKYTNIDRLTGQATYLLPVGNISVGRGTHLVGNNIGGSIILNNAANDYGYFSGELSLGKLRLSLLHASLIPDDLTNYKTNESQDRYLVLHQLDYKPSKALHFFFGEEIIYANRSVDFSYLIPHTFYRITEHNLGDRDNVLIYTGLNWRVSKNVLLYGNVALDELKKSEILGDWWGNKYAVQTGVSLDYADGLFVRDKLLRTTLEATAVRPWIYTHKVLANAFSHNGVGLGFPEGSNVVQLAEETVIPITKNITFNHFIAHTQQGSIGSYFGINYNDRPSDTAKWLDGKLSKRWAHRNALTYSLSAHQNIKIGVELKKENSETWQKELVFGYQAVY
jgi:hypothetical protein